MPMYGFRCPECGLEFEVSRKMSEATKPATCPLDGVVGERVFTAVATILGGRRAESPPDPAGAAAPKPQNQWSHFGHSHGFGAGGHSHGAPRPAAPKADAG